MLNVFMNLFRCFFSPPVCSLARSLFGLFSFLQWGRIRRIRLKSEQICCDCDCLCVWVTFMSFYSNMSLPLLLQLLHINRQVPSFIHLCIFPLYLSLFLLTASSSAKEFHDLITRCIFQKQSQFTMLMNTSPALHTVNGVCIMLSNTKACNKKRDKHGNMVLLLRVHIW